MPRTSNEAFLACGVLMLACTPSLGDVAAWRSLQSATPSLLFQYSFEGDATQRLLDTAGVEGRDLTLTLGSNGGDAGGIVFGQGLDASTTALSPDRTNETTGASYRYNFADNPGDPLLELPQTMTVEFLIQPNSQTPVYNDPGEDDFAYAVATRIWPRRRGYYIAQDESGNIITVIGSNFTSNRRTIIPSSQIEEGAWYYYAITLNATDSAMDLEPNELLFPAGSDTEVDSYLAKLTTGGQAVTQATLTHVLDETVAGGFSGPKNTVSSGNIGVGMFEEVGDGRKQFWDGAVDEVAFYSEILSQADLQARVDTILAAAPGLEGDYNGDGVVDAVDYALWREGLAPDPGPTGYSDWAANYGAAQPSSVSVPEPGSPFLVLALLAARACATNRDRSRVRTSPSSSFRSTPGA